MKRRHASAARRSPRIPSDQNTVTKYRRLPSTFLFICQSLAIAPHFVEFCRDLHFLNGIITHPSLKQNDNFEQIPVDLDMEFATLGFGEAFCDRKSQSGTFGISRTVAAHKTLCDLITTDMYFLSRHIF